MICSKCKKEIPDDSMLCCYCGKSIVRRKPTNAKRQHGAGTAYKRGRTWTAYVTVGFKTTEDGKLVQIRKSKGGFKTKTDALNYCQFLKIQPEEKKKCPLLLNYWQTYSAGELPKLSASKQQQYNIAWEKLKSLHKSPVDTLTVADLRNVVGEKAKTFYPARDMKVVLSHLFNLAAADGYASKDLPSFIILPDKDEKERTPFTVEEQEKLWRSYEAGNAMAAIPLIMIYTGMMTGEMQKLEVSMIDFENRQIIGVGLKTDVRKASPVFLPEAILPVLQECCECKKKKVFPYNKDNFYVHYYNALDIAGIRKLNPYSCRHTTATALAINKNIAPQTVKKIMRWSTTKMLDRYAHPDNEDAISAIDTLEKL